MADDLDELLSLIDEPSFPGDAVADVEARVWARLHGDAPHLESTVVAQRRQHRDGRSLALVAASVLVVVGLVGIGLLRDGEQAPSDEPAPVTTATTGPTTIPAIVERSDACTRYRSEAGTLGDLGDAAAADDVLGAATAMERATRSLDVLIDDFEAGGEDPGVVESLQRVQGSIAQAGLHLADDDVPAAVLALEFATRTYTSSGLADDHCLG